MPKAIAFPTDAKLYFKSIQALVKMADSSQITLRQTYKKLAKTALCMRARYAHARQLKRAKREEKRLHNYLGRLIRDFERKTEGQALETESSYLLEIIKRIYAQQRNDSRKVYSLHEPHVECIAKGKVEKKYEFGCKASLVITHQEGLALDLRAIHGNPYDGHTLEEAIRNAQNNSGKNIEVAFVDKGYRGHTVEGKTIFISGQRKGLTQWIKSQLKRRQAIEPHIGHMKNDGKLGRNYLKGRLGDCFNAILCGIGHNMRLIYNWLVAQSSPKRLYSG
ncbi:IS5 family transposase [Neochlamydia sp. S13]|uniref:IS5 family transposase n=1 Tax=Neochlamydia sp. S13 TaxID=1353976 RepID=UPI000FD17CB6|nr:IS5 family transposase [Neochlamydia sp. S13]BBI16852.1 Transposase [Neochlamydia sp. S13]